MTDDAHAARRPSRADGRPAAPVRSVHLGLGNFFRAHQCWFTEHAPDAADWGIAAFTGMALGPAQDIADQDGVYTLVVQAADGDVPETISSLTEVHGSDELDAWRRVFELPDLAFVSTTVTEAGYRRSADGGLDQSDPEVVADIAKLRADGLGAEVTTAPGKLILALMVRREKGFGGFTVLPCDNVPDNGEMAERVLTEMAQAVDSGLSGWIAENITFVTTMVDRITPRATDADLDALRARGIDDPAAVVTEPYLEWVLSGEFRAGRPRWEEVGARFVADIVPWEHRKLWLLNGSHSLMAYAAPIRGHATVADAITDPVVRGWVEEWWDEACRHLPLPEAELTAYRQALVERFANPRIRHLLAQIAADGSQKVPIRIVPTAQGELAAGRPATGALRAIAAWVLHLSGKGAPVTDAQGAAYVELAAQPLERAIPAILATLGIDDAAAAQRCVDLAGEIENGDD
ncbi:MAG: mannitol dehydrogenase family protein [Tetrasphaera sp.]